MNIIVFTKHRGSSRQFDLKRPATFAIFACSLLAVTGILFSVGFLTAANQRHIDPDRRVVELQAEIDARNRAEATAFALRQSAGDSTSPG